MGHTGQAISAVEWEQCLMLLRSPAYGSKLAQRGWDGREKQDFPDVPVVMKLPSNAGDAGLILGQELGSHMPWGN